MPDFRENGVIRCARLESKKSASGADKKFLHGGMVAEEMSRGGLIINPPPGRFRVKTNAPRGQSYLAGSPSAPTLPQDRT